MFVCEVPPPFLARADSRYAECRATDPSSKLRMELYLHIRSYVKSGSNLRIISLWMHAPVPGSKHLYDGHIVNAAHKLCVLARRYDSRIVKKNKILRWEETSGPSTPPLFLPAPARLQPDNTEDNMQAAVRNVRRSEEGTCPHLVHPWFIRQLAKARARQSFHTCTKWSRLPSSPDGPQSLLMPPSPPLPQASQSENIILQQLGWLPTGSRPCQLSSLPPGEPQPFLEKLGLDLATASTKLHNRDPVEEGAWEKKHPELHVWNLLEETVS